MILIRKSVWFIIKRKSYFNESDWSQKIITSRYYLKLKFTKYEDLKRQEQIEDKFSDALIDNGLYWFRNSSQVLRFSKKKINLFQVILKIKTILMK